MKNSRFAIPTLTVLLAVGCSQSAHPKTGEKMRSTSEELYVQMNTLWANPGAIPVCFEDPGHEDARGWIQDAVTSAWEGNDAAIHFTGWTDCTENAPGIHVAAQTDPQDSPHTTALGQQLDGVQGGMILDFDNISSAPIFAPCPQMPEVCMRAIATHEFGHALGFNHEQARPDTPDTCHAEPPDPQQTPLGEWDLMSIMNYCYPNRDTVWPTQLSAGDVAGLNQVYPSNGGGAAPPGSGDPGAGSVPPGQGQDPDSPFSLSKEKKKAKSEDTSDDDDADGPSEAPAIASSGCSVPGGTAPDASWLTLVAAVIGARKRRHSSGEAK